MPPLITSHPDAFPSAPPPDLDDARAITAHDWRAFDSLTEMQDHWQRPGWTSKTRAFYWLLTIADEPAFAAQARQCQEAVRHFQAFDLIDSGSFHLTLGRIADVDAVNESLLFRLAPGSASQRATCLHALRTATCRITWRTSLQRCSVDPSHRASSATGRSVDELRTAAHEEQQPTSPAHWHRLLRQNTSDRPRARRGEDPPLALSCGAGN